jgi:hypothetical protein
VSQTILLVGENADDLSRYCDALSGAGYHPITTLIGTDRVLHPAEHPAVIVLDCPSARAIAMRELTLLLREIYSDCPILVYCNSEDIPEDTKRLVQAFLRKGEPHELIATVRQMTGGTPGFL